MSDAPLAETPFTDGNSRLVSNSQITAPVAEAYARRAPSLDPENTTPGIAVTAADCAALQLLPLPHAGAPGAVNHAR
jgi:hypothetical protein